MHVVLSNPVFLQHVLGPCSKRPPPSPTSLVQIFLISLSPPAWTFARPRLEELKIIENGAGTRQTDCYRFCKHVGRSVELSLPSTREVIPYSPTDRPRASGWRCRAHFSSTSSTPLWKRKPFPPSLLSSLAPRFAPKFPFIIGRPRKWGDAQSV